MIVNYESEVHHIIKNKLKEYYNLEKEWFEFLLCKFIIHYDKKIVKPEYSELIFFILKELKIKKEQNYIVYKGTNISFYLQRENSLSNILDEYFMLEKYDLNVINDKIKKGKIYARKNNKIPKTDNKYKQYRKMFIMEFIEKEYGVKYNELNMIKGFEYDYDFYSRTIKEFYEWEKSMYDKDVKPYLLTETILENYLYEHLEKIGEYKPIAKQTIIGEGRLDLWVRNNENENVLIECKIISNPKDLLWQCLNYPQFFEENFGQNISKMLIVSPLLKESLMKKIKEKIDIPVEFIVYEEMFNFQNKTFEFEFKYVI